LNQVSTLNGALLANRKAELPEKLTFSSIPLNLTAVLLSPAIAPLRPSVGPFT
jgi:hypothetical protein